MLMVAIVLIALVAVPATGGSLRRLGQIRLESPWLIFTGLGVQVLVTIMAPSLPTGLAKILHIASYFFILAFLVANRRYPGLKILTFGALLNFVAIAANGGTMPARAAALRTAGIGDSVRFANSAVVADARVPFLGDVFAVPARFPLANVFSVGDALIVG